MLSKGSELFAYEGDLFKLKQRWINEDMNEEKWRELMTDGHKLLKKYDFENPMLEYYCFQEFATFVDFLGKKVDGEFSKSKSE